MNAVNKFKKSVAVWIITILIVEIFIAVLMYFRGLRITYAPNLETSWNAVGAVGQWFSAAVGVLIPIAAIFLQHKLDQNKEEIGASNVAVLKELQEFKETYEKKLEVLSQVVDDKGEISIDGGSFVDLKENKQVNMKNEAVKFIDIAMMANTHRVAEHLGIPDEEAFEILRELALHDRTISCAGQLTDRNINGITWLPKSGR